MMTALQTLLNTEITIYEQLQGGFNFSYKELTPLIYCMDETTLSVQSGAHNYCTPQDNNGPWTHVEVGFPSKHFELLDEYQDGDDVPEKSVYGYVPIEIVEECIAQCGGINVAKTIIMARQK
jgi:hypothetical protein